MAKTTAVAASGVGGGFGWLKDRWERIVSFLRDVRSEMRKVVAPSRTEVQATTIVVITTVFLFAAYFWIVDAVIGHAIEAVLHHLT